MKILLSWLLDYLDCAPSDINIEKIVHLFNTRTAEIESFQQVNFDHASFFPVKVVSIQEKITVFCPELNQTVTISKRNDAQINKFYLATLANESFSWTTNAELGSEKDGLFPAIHIDEKLPAQKWKSSIPVTDYILEVDNKSINHRPDLWGHYGIAREVAAFLNIGLKPFATFKEPVKILEFEHSNKQEPNHNIKVNLQADKDCSRFAITNCNNIKNTDSDLLMAIRLARVDSKPINALVDITNYVMFDTGHPMHAFDATFFTNDEINVRMAQNKETLELLDGQKIELAQTDIVISNSSKCLSLAGIMGGKNSAVHDQTKNIVLEAAGFNPLTIRKTAQRLKIRTEASIRFEKHIDPMQNILAIQRFIFLAKKLNIITEQTTQSIISVGKTVTPATCTLKHSFVEKKLGINIDSVFIKNTLEKLNFQVSYDSVTHVYTVTIPTNRMTKDIKIQEDLVEEIIRSYGFENLPATLPSRQTEPFDISTTETIKKIKNHAAFGMNMHELRDYLLYDAAFIARLPIDLKDAICVRNPMSLNWTTLATSLVPHLLKAVENNAPQQNHLRFFELNSIWHKKNNEFIETKSLAGIIFDKKNVDFYQAKLELQSLFELLNLNVVWTKPKHTIPEWYNHSKVAELQVCNNVIGFAGMISDSWIDKITKGSAFIFELDAAKIYSLESKNILKFEPWSKFQNVWYDISIFIPKNKAIDSIKSAILQTDSTIQSVEIVDFFEKEEWPNLRAVTLRYLMNNPEKTLNKQEIDQIVAKVIETVTQNDAQIR